MDDVNAKVIAYNKLCKRYCQRRKCCSMDDVNAKVIAYNKVCSDMQSSMSVLGDKILEEFCRELQGLEECASFRTRNWKMSEDVGGITKFIDEGDIFEKAGICTSSASGALSKSAFFMLNERNENENVPVNPTYFTAGITGVAYPRNPHIPTLNFSYRYFEIKDGDDCTWWFGGGTDLSPYILNVEDCKHFHRTLKQCCDLYDGEYYKKFKKACDEHFYLEHRGVSRGIGGIFFNDLNYPDKNTCFKFVSACVENIVPSYLPIVMKNKATKYFAHEKEWQLIQRGRCVEFSFICDKATKLALMTPGIEHENILICLPPSAKWPYSCEPAEKSKESELVHILQNPIDWV